MAKPEGFATFPRIAILPTLCNALRSWIAGNRYAVGKALWAWQRLRFADFWQKTWRKNGVRSRAHNAKQRKALCENALRVYDP